MRLILLYCCVVAMAASTGAAPKARSGAEIYKADCARCHGKAGEGVADKHDEPLYGDRSIEALARLIARTMPDDKDQKTTPEDAAKVAAYIHDAFYSPAARARNQPPRIELARLTVQQYLNTVADLVGTFRKVEELGEKHGLAAIYYNGRNLRDEKKAIERTDPRVEFNFGEAGPDSDTNKIAAQEFAIRWRGSVVAEETGDYEFALKTENGARLWVNTQPRNVRGGGGPSALIDGWVSSGAKVRDERGTIRLLGGRVYPIQLDFFKYKDKTASIALWWKPPHKTWQLIPEQNLVPVRVAETMVASTAFPADDRSVGYERGTSVSKAWDQATTYSAIQVANWVVEHLNQLADPQADSYEREQQVRNFCAKFAERAIRRPLSAEEKKIFVDRQFEGAKDTEAAVKRVVLLALKSPQFLYPEIADDNSRSSYLTAARLAYGLWDSMPDAELLLAAEEGRLRTSEQTVAQIERMMNDPRARTKLREFFHRWLEMDNGQEISKDPKAFPEFNEQVLSDLRRSLDLFIEEVVWSPASDYRQLLQSDYLFLNGRLAKLYGADLPEDADFQKVSFKSKERTGVITHPYLLSVFAYHKSSSPIHRGVFLTRNIVGRALKPPPMAIQFMDGRFDPSLTMREKVSELTRPSTCQTCHSVINPLGFSLESYDAVGRLRTTDNKKPVDTASEYTTTDGKTVRIRGARDVADYAAKSKEAHLAFIQHLFNHMIKQPAGAYGADTLERLRRSFVKSQFNIRKLVVEIVKTSATHRDGESENISKGTTETETTKSRLDKS